MVLLWGSNVVKTQKVIVRLGCDGKPSMHQRCSAPTTAPFDECMRDIFTLEEAIPHLDAYLSSIVIDYDDPGFLISWDLINLNAFVAAANLYNAIPAPRWLRTRPPNITVNSFADDLVHKLYQYAGGRCGRILLAPNNLQQFAAVTHMLCSIQTHPFMQNVAQMTLPILNNVPRYLAMTYNLSETRAHKSEPNNLPVDEAARVIFI